MRKVWKEVIWMIIFLDLIWVTSGAVLNLDLQETDLCPTTSYYMNKEVKVITKVQCSAICLMEVNCHGICYNSVKGICRTFSSDLATSRRNAAPDPGFKMFWGDGFIRYSTKAYYLGTTFVNFLEAKTRCSSLGATLAVPMNQEENDILTAMGSGFVFWINVSDEDTEGLYVNGKTGETATYFNWIYYAPLGSTDRNCISVTRLPFVGGKWTDISCGYTLAYICEKPV